MQSLKNDEFFEPKHKKLLNAAFLLNLFAWFELIVGSYVVISDGYNYFKYSGIIEAFSRGGFHSEFWTWILPTIFSHLHKALLTFVSFILLRAMSRVLRIVVETDINYRAQLQKSASLSSEYDIEERILLEGELQELPSLSENEGLDTPAFYSPKEVMKITRWMDKGLWLAIVITLGLNLLNMPAFFHNLSVVFGLAGVSRTIIGLIAGFLILSGNTLIIYFLLKAFRQSLPILMEMEFNSRKGEF